MWGKFSKLKIAGLLLVFLIIMLTISVIVVLTKPITGTSTEPSKIGANAKLENTPTTKSIISTTSDTIPVVTTLANTVATQTQGDETTKVSNTPIPQPSIQNTPFATAIPATLENTPTNIPTMSSPTANTAETFTSSYQLLAHNSIAGGHSAAVNGVAFSPDATRMVSVSVDTLIKLWKISGSPTAPVITPDCTLNNNQHFPLTSVAWSPIDPQLIVTGDTGGGLKIWNQPCQNSQPLVLPGISGIVRVVRFSPDGRWLATGGSDTILRVWDVASHQLAFSYDNGHSDIHDITWFPDGSKLAFVSNLSQVKILSLQANNNKLQEVLNRTGNGGPLYSINLSPDSRWLIAGDQSGGINIWDAQNQFNISKYFRVAAINAVVQSLAFSSDGTTLFTGSGDNTVRFWTLSVGTNGQLQLKLGPRTGGHDGPVKAVALATNQHWLVSSSDDRSIKLWDTTNGSLLGMVGENSGTYLTSINWIAKSNQFVTGASDGKIRIWQSEVLPLVTSFNDINGIPTRATAVSADGNWLATIGDSGQLSIWKLSDNLSLKQTPVGRIKAEDNVGLAVAFSPDNQHLVTAGRNGTISLLNWNGTKLELVTRSQTKLRPIRTLAFSPNGSVVVSGSDDGKLTLWDSSTLKYVRDMIGHTSYIKATAFNQEGTQLVSAGGDGTVRLWDISSGTQISSVQLQAVPEAIAITSDAKTIAAATDDGQIVLWQPSDNRPYLTIKAQSANSALNLAFATDTTQLVAVGIDGAIQKWKLDLKSPDSSTAPLPPANYNAGQQTGSDFVTSKDGQLYLQGRLVKLKGFNFYSHVAPWASMWQHWNGPQVASDLAKADELGANTLRLLIPYGPGYGWTDDNGTIDPAMLNELDQMLNLAAQHHMRVLLTLFDFYNDFPAAGTQAEAANWHYLATLVTKYANDPRVLGWDLHNEPDNYDSWKNGNTNQVLDWLQREALQIRLHDPNHLMTVGFGYWGNLKMLAANGIDPIALDNMVALHAYDPSKLDQIISETTIASGPIPYIFEEFGWPSAPREVTSAYSEEVQAQYYQSAFDAIAKYNMSGMVAWQLWDITPESILNLKPNLFQDFFGLVRLDGTFKQAAQTWKGAYPASPLSVNSASAPSSTLTVRQVDESLYPQFFPQSGFAISTPFKEYWNQQGGADSFGFPISGVLQEGGLLVQYFERGRLEYHPENNATPGSDKLSTQEQLKLVVKVSNIGQEWIDRQHLVFPTALPKPDLAYFPQSQHNIDSVFKSYWEAHGGLERFGYPLSEATSEISATDGKTYLIQYFQRAKLVYQENVANQAKNVQISPLGRELLTLQK